MKKMMRSLEDLPNRCLIPWIPGTLRFLIEEQILHIHEIMLAKYGGKGGIHFHSALKNCIDLPYAEYYGMVPYPSIWSKADALFHCIVTQHPFTDGNKRTGWVAAKMLLALNRHELSADTAIVEDFIKKVAQGELTVDEIATWLKKHSIISNFK